MKTKILVFDPLRNMLPTQSKQLRDLIESYVLDGDGMFGKYLVRATAWDGMHEHIIHLDNGNIAAKPSVAIVSHYDDRTTEAALLRVPKSASSLLSVQQHLIRMLAEYLLKKVQIDGKNGDRRDYAPLTFSAIS